MPRMTKKRIEKFNTINDYIEQKLGEHNWEAGNGFNNSNRNDISCDGDIVLNTVNFHKDFFPVGGAYDIFTLLMIINYEVCGDSYDTTMTFQISRNVEGVKNFFPIGRRKTESIGLKNLCNDILEEISFYEEYFCKRSLVLVPCKKEQGK